MANAVLSITPEFGMTESIRFKTYKTEFESGRKRTSSQWDKGLREFRLNLKFLTESEMNTIWDFYVARKGAYESFLIKMSHEYEITAEAIGSGNGVLTDFTLDEFPVDASSITLYDDGVEVAGSVANNFSSESATATYTAAPSGVLTADYDFYFLVRFAEDELSREMIAYQLLHTGMVLQEARWTSYEPRAGNA